MSDRVYIRHRVNRRADLAALDLSWGVEIDLRSDVGRQGSLHLSHDAWQRGEDFDPWLAEYVRCGLRGPLILNTKEDGLEEAALALLERHGVASYLFLDTTLPTLVRLTQKGLTAFAVRYSRFEPAALAEAFVGRAQWLWVDCFAGQAPPAAPLRALKRDYRICLVSPELQGHPADALDGFAELAALADAVCTKSPSTWRARFP